VSSASEDNRATFVANLVDIVTRYGYDGLDLDWEPILPEDTTDVLALVSDLRAALPDAILTMPVGFENANLPSDLSQYAQLAGDLDQINAMTYGMAGDYPGWKSWHSSALYHDDDATPTSVDVTVNAYLAAGVPAAKLGVGAGFYGLCYSPPVTGPLQRLGTSTVIADEYELAWNNLHFDATRFRHPISPSMDELNRLADDYEWFLQANALGVIRRKPDLGDREASFQPRGQYLFEVEPGSGEWLQIGNGFAIRSNGLPPYYRPEPQSHKNAEHSFAFADPPE